MFSNVRISTVGKNWAGYIHSIYLNDVACCNTYKRKYDKNMRNIDNSKASRFWYLLFVAVKRSKSYDRYVEPLNPSRKSIKSIEIRGKRQV